MGATLLLLRVFLLPEHRECAIPIITRVYMTRSLLSGFMVKI